MYFNFAKFGTKLWTSIQIKINSLIWVMISSLLQKLLISSLGVKRKSRTTLKEKGSARERAKPKQKI
ncbi:MAG: hypothetical protein AN490_12590 [Anabaena sp. AL09]|nr:MAG: hypothetical protein AN490_12590 [Anabaena sp. AL09]OBQ10660.1 MAG: hypothetical protein AN482_09415 [Anabaena sp. LE011-02]